MDESRRLGDAEADLAGAGRRRRARPARPAAAHPQPAPPTTRPTARREADNVVVRVVGYDPDGYGPHQRVPHWEIGTALGILDNERAAKISGSMFTMLRGLGATLSRALCQLRARPQRRCLRGDPSAVAGHDRDAHGHRPAARSSPTTPTPSSATTCGASRRPRCRSRRSARDEVLAEAELPMRFMAYTPCYRREAGSAGRDTRGHAARSTSSTRSRSSPTRRRSRRPTLLDELLGRAEALIGGARPAVPDARDLHGRPRPEPPPQLRHRGVRAGRRPVARGQLGVVVQRLPGPPGQHPLPAGRGQGHRGGPHAQRLGAGGARGCWPPILETYRQPDGSVAIPEALWPYTPRRPRIPATS